MLAIIGGTGLYQLPALEVKEKHMVKTPYGPTSAAIVEANYHGNTVFFLPRHGTDHRFLPHEVNYRANIWALKSLGVKQIIAVSAVGSLQPEIAPGDLVLPTQYVDFVQDGRAKSFFGEGLVAHMATAQPICPTLSSHVLNAAKAQNLPISHDKTYLAISGPRFNTRAESLFFSQTLKADILGMTNVPEVFLALEAQICYSAIAIVTDYDCWKENPDEQVSVASVMEAYFERLEMVKRLLEDILANPLPAVDDAHRLRLKSAVLTKGDALSDEKKTLLALLMQ